MSCHDVERLLARYVAGEATGEGLERLHDHLHGCERCRALVVAATRPVPEDAEATGEEIVAGVIARTSGSTCGAAETHLHAFVSAELDADNAELVATHLGGCADCRALAEVLSWSPGVCREMAFIEPPPGFTARVAELSAGVRSPRVLVRRIRRAWFGAIMRPRFPLELAYVGALVVALLVGTPNAPLRALLPEVAALARTNPVEVVVAGSQSGGVVGAVVSVAAWTYEQSARRTAATASVVDDVASDGGSLVKAIFAGDIGTVGVQLNKVGGDLERLLHAIGRGVTGDSLDTRGEMTSEQ